MPIEVLHTVDPYNTSRYSRPWIARVKAWPLGKRAELEFGTTGKNGKTLAVAAEPGDILLYGQKDNRGNNSYLRYARALEDATLEDITEDEARAAFRAHAPAGTAKPSYDELVELLARTVPYIGSIAPINSDENPTAWQLFKDIRSAIMRTGPSKLTSDEC